MDAIKAEEIVKGLLKENDRRNAIIYAKFDPVTGEGSIGRRVKVHISDHPLPDQWLPVRMMRIPLVKQIVEAGFIERFLLDYMEVEEVTEEDFQKVLEQFTRMRMRYDFAFWAACFVYIKRKGGGTDCLFRLTRPQRRFVKKLEKYRSRRKPIRIILLKARQWGGSTTSQLYMAWLQLVHRVGLNSLIIAHQGTGSDEIKDMFDRMIAEYPIEFLYKLGEEYNENEPKLVGVGKSGAIHRVPQRNCKIKIGTAERPDSCRGGDYNLVHLSEVGIWKATDGKKPEDIVRSATSGILLKPYTMIVYESTANGTGNFFHREYEAAKKKQSQFENMFVSWFDIEQYTLAFDSEKKKKKFAEWLWKNRNNDNIPSDREEPGKYLWWLWNKGATLEAINWYVEERKKYNDHGQMAAEFPSDDVEAFVHSGQRVFDKYKVEVLEKSVRPPRYVGDVYGKGDEGKEALMDLKFTQDAQGQLWVWSLPEIWEDEKVTNRYLTVVDVGGRSNKADWSVIVVFDRYWMMEGDKPCVVAQWYGHIDIDLLAWKAAQIAKFYDNSLLVIESNTLETHDKERDTEGDQSGFILNQIRSVYKHLYARKQSAEDIKKKAPKKYGFHTNVSTKPMIITTLVRVIRENMYIERDQRCLDEYINYEKKPNGAYGAIVGAHDDLLMTRAIGLHICFFEMPVPKIVMRVNEFAPAKKKVVSAATI